MSFTVTALVVGVLLGLVTGGRPSNVNRRPLRLVSLLVISVGAQTAAELVDMGDTLALSVVLVSYAGLAAFALANIRLIGMPVVLVGLTCNLVVIAANGGMPVRPAALLAAEAAAATELPTLDLGAKRQLEEPDDVLVALADIIPVRVTEEVVSFGDLILAVGVGNVAFRLLRPIRPRRRRPDEPGEPGEPVGIDEVHEPRGDRLLAGVP